MDKWKLESKRSQNLTLKQFNIINIKIEYYSI